MSRIDALIDLRRPSSDGRAFVYLLPLYGEELLKLGFSRDPVVRMRTLHRRYFDFFDLERAWIVETDRVREARTIERKFKQRVNEHRAPAPLEIRPQAGGDMEWYRGAYETLRAAAAALAADGYAVHLHARPWLRDQLLARSAGLFEWSLQTYEQMQLGRARRIRHPGRGRRAGRRRGVVSRRCRPPSVCMNGTCMDSVRRAPTVNPGCTRRCRARPCGPSHHEGS